jgi:hypothetical protein
MRRLQELCYSIFLLIASNGNGEIIQGNVEIKVNEGFVFGGELFDLSASGGAGFNTENNYKNADIIVETAFCPLCMGCCCSWEIGSTRPFYISRIHFDSTDFSKQLDLNDTAKFQFIDSTRDNYRKFLPHTDKIPLDGKYIVFKNVSKKHALMKPIEISKFIPDYSNPMKQCTNGVKGFWMLQDSYSVPYFPRPSNRVVGINTFPKYKGVNYFDDFLLNGRKIQPNTLKKY